MNTSTEICHHWKQAGLVFKGFMGSMVPACPWCENEKLRGEFSLAEEGLANYHQEALRLHEQIAVLQGERTNYQQEVEQLRKANEKLQTLVIWSVDTMSALHRAIEPMENDPELAGRVPPAAMRAFVDALADIDRERFVPHPKTD